MNETRQLLNEMHLNSPAPVQSRLEYLQRKAAGQEELQTVSQPNSIQLSKPVILLIAAMLSLVLIGVVTNFF